LVLFLPFYSGSNKNNNKNSHNNDSYGGDNNMVVTAVVPLAKTGGCVYLDDRQWSGRRHTDSAEVWIIFL